MLNDYAALGSQEIWNTARTEVYMTNLGSPFDTGPGVCGCPTLTQEIIEYPATEGVPYDTPAADPAPWYDVDQDHSGDYLGFLPMSIGGIEDNPRGRSVTNAVGGGGVFGPSRSLPRTITVTGLIVGRSCCGATYGLQYLSEALSQCTADACDGDCLVMYNCCPGEETPAVFNADHRRTFRRTALVSGPTVVQTNGSGQCTNGGCAAGGTIITVEFVLVAANPWAWSDVLPLLDVPLPTADGSTPCIDWCLRDPETDTGDCPASDCLFGSCAADTGCDDPLNTIPAPPQPTAPLTSFCVPLGSERDCYDIDLSFRPGWSSDVPMITINAGSSPLRNVRVLMFIKPVGSLLSCDTIADNNRCDPIEEFVITYVPAGGVLILDGQIGKALLVCNDTCQQATTVYGDQDGGPVRFNELSCATYCLCIETDPAYPPATDASISFGVSGRNM